MPTHHTLAALALFAAAAAPAHADNVALAADGQWKEFLVTSDLAADFGVGWVDADNDYSPLSFSFTIGAGSTGLLTIVDAGFAGDTFTITNFDSAAGFGATSAVASAVYDPDAVGITDFDAALADSAFSRKVFSLGAGTYQISGLLDQSVTFDGTALNSTIGGIRLETVTPIPEPTTTALMLAGLGVLGFVARRRVR